MGQDVECLQAYRNHVGSAPEEVSSLAIAGVMPDDEIFPADAVDQFKVAFLGCHSGHVREVNGRWHPSPSSPN